VLIKAVNRTNPNKQWDWYVVGGRWTGMLKLKPGAKGNLGRPGTFGNQAEIGAADQARKGDIDWDGMRDQAGNDAAKRWDAVRAVAPNLWTSWEAIREQHSPDIDAARTAYHYVHLTAP
jgi:hypothetical protein